MVHDFNTGPLEDAQLAVVLLLHDAQRRQVNLGVAEDVQVLLQPELLEQLVDGALQGTPGASAAAAHARGAAPAAPAADAQASDAPGLAAVIGEAVRLAAAVLARSATAGAPLGWLVMGNDRGFRGI